MQRLKGLCEQYNDLVKVHEIVYTFNAIPEYKTELRVKCNLNTNEWL